MSIPGPPPDIIGAIVAYLQGAMGQSLLSANGSPQVYTDFAPQTNPDGSPVSQPYAVVTEGPETYEAQSDDPGTGFYLSNIAAGTAMVSFVATTKAQARALARAGVRLMSDPRAELSAADGRVLTLLPLRAETVPITAAGVQQPTAFARVVTVNYKQQFLE